MQQHRAPNPFLTLFQQKAQVLEATCSTKTPEDAIDMLAAWMTGRMEQLSEEDVIFLSEVGAILLRDGHHKGNGL